MVQGQIGGESRPGSPSDASASLWRSLELGVNRSREQPSGRLLEPRRELRPRGMIVRHPYLSECLQNPAYMAHPLIFNKLDAFSTSVSAEWAQAADHESGLVTEPLIT